MSRTADVTHRTEVIGPALAAKYLEQNNRNRKIRERRVAELAEIMLIPGAWMENGEAGITFDWNGDLAGGQHTLSAIVRTGATLTLRVTRGVDPDARHTMNDSARQRFADDLTVSGVGDSGRAEALLRKIIIWEQVAAGNRGAGGIATWRSHRHGRAVLAQAWPQYAAGIVRTVQEANQYREGWRSVQGTGGALDLGYWLLMIRSGNNPVRVHEFFEKMANGSSDEDDKLLFQKLRARIARDNRGEYQVWWIIRVWNAWTRNEKLTKLQLGREGGKVSDPYPRIARG